MSTTGPAARVIAIANQKGGVGKTTLTLFLARSAVTHWGARVLVVDMDPSGNASTGLLGAGRSANAIGLADAFAPSTNVPLREVIVPTRWEGVDLAPATIALTAADSQVAAIQWGREQRLREILAPVLPDYDLVIIDNAPSLLGMLLVNSLSAADGALLVTAPDTWSSDGLALLARTLGGVKQHLNPRLEVIGCVVNMWQNTTVDHRVTTDLIEGMAAAFPGVPVWADPARRIPRTVKIRDAVDHGRGLDESNAQLRVLNDDSIRPITGSLLGRTVTI